MLGPEKVRDLDRPILTSLEALVPAANLYRHLDAKLDLGFVRDWVQVTTRPQGCTYSL